MIPYDVPLAVGASPINLGPHIVRTALKVQARGWELALKNRGFDTGSHERLLAGHLKTGMVAALQELGVHAYVQEAVGTRSVRSAQEADGEADIALWFYRSFEHNDPHLIIECKRVDQADAHLIREYVNEGIDRFLKGHYRPGENGCFMTGFVTGGGVRAIVTRINAYLTKKARPRCHLLADAAHADLGHVFTSNHGVTAGLAIANVKHSFLPVPPPVRAKPIERKGASPRNLT